MMSPCSVSLAATCGGTCVMPNPKHGGVCDIGESQMHDHDVVGLEENDVRGSWFWQSVLLS